MEAELDGLAVIRRKWHLESVKSSRNPADKGVDQG
jgi:hypothetical protein